MKAKSCHHCKKIMTGRIGRGLCRPCWDDRSIRERYPQVAPFGGKVAGKMSRRLKNYPPDLSRLLSRADAENPPDSGELLASWWEAR